MRRHRDWLRQARRKLESAKWDIEGGFFEDACFSAQQAAELAVKALFESKGEIKFGHSIFHLLREWAEIPVDILGAAQVLDRYYIPTRYPNSFDRGSPMDYFDRKTAQEAVGFAEIILKFVEGKVAGV